VEATADPDGFPSGLDIQYSTCLPLSVYLALYVHPCHSVCRCICLVWLLPGSGLATRHAIEYSLSQCLACTLCSPVLLDFLACSSRLPPLPVPFAYFVMSDALVCLFLSLSLFCLVCLSSLPSVRAYHHRSSCRSYLSSSFCRPCLGEGNGTATTQEWCVSFLALIVLAHVSRPSPNTARFMELSAPEF
jgi:hypothetical protein